ncbi:MAG: murein L,D-transpeptidase catalytic domain family protein [Crocinitomicaceae bacterium]|nr:murein L,D-transpeptidase catalytic domain family protein [Crocinitomicaceae bacterium]
MQRKTILIFLLLWSGFSFSNTEDEAPKNVFQNDSVYSCAKSNFDDYAYSEYLLLNNSSLPYEAFKQGLTGYHNLIQRGELPRDEYLTIIDFSQPSSNERMYIIDMCTHKIIHQTYVAHGRNSGGLYARHFSNEDNSHQSSIGFYVTTTTYKGKYDLALRLKGMEYTNSHASRRGVVMHAAKYANPDFLESNGCTLGRSYGCPALPEEGFSNVVEWIKEGTCLFIYYPSRSYKRHSKYLNRRNYLVEFV